MIFSFSIAMAIVGQAKLLRNATLCLMFVTASACATQSSKNGPEWAAYGYLTPGPLSEPEMIGVFASKRACEKAADEWASQQVVGNPVYAECYPVDRH